MLGFLRLVGKLVLRTVGNCTVYFQKQKKCMHAVGIERHMGLGRYQDIFLSDFKIYEFLSTS